MLKNTVERSTIVANTPIKGACPMAYTVPYSIEMYTSALHIKLHERVYADGFFAYAAELQQIFETAIYDQTPVKSIYIDFSKTIWFDTLSLCYLLMFVKQSVNLKSENIHFTFPEECDITQAHLNREKYLIFHAFLHDNGFLTQMRNIGHVDNLTTVAETRYSTIHECVWPLQIFNRQSEIARSIDLIKQQLHNEFFNELNSYELTYLIEKVTYFLQETLDNAYKHGYAGIKKDRPCALLIKRVRSADTMDISSYRRSTLDHAPYLSVSLFEEMHEYLEIYVADVGIGLRRSFLEYPDGRDSHITDANILDFILTEGKRSQKIISSDRSSRYGGLYDITAMFKGDGDKLGFKGDTHWFFNQKSSRVNDQIPYGEYAGFIHGFAIVGNISWKKRHSGDYPLIQEIQHVTQHYKSMLFADSNPWMIANYCRNIFVSDSRFSEDTAPVTAAPLAILFPAKNLVKEKIIAQLSCFHSHTVIIAGIHESEYKKYQTMLCTLDTAKINSELRCVIVITNTLFPHYFKRSSNQIKYSQADTKKYIETPFVSPTINSPATSYISFRLWKRVYDSEQLWNRLSQNNDMAYINSQVQWNDKSLRGYLDFSQLTLIPECRSLCLEQLTSFLLYQDQLYFRSLDRFTDEICEEANHLMDNSQDGKTYWIGSVFVSGSSERKLHNEDRDAENVFYFFKHADCETYNNKIYTMLEWSTQPARINTWFAPGKFQGKEYSRVGNTSFVAEGGSRYWASRHYQDWKNVYQIRQDETYQLLQKQFGAHPAILKMGHFDSADHHDLFEIKADSLVNTDIITHQILQDNDIDSYKYLVAEFLLALVPSVPKIRSKLTPFFNANVSDHTKASVVNLLPISKKRKTFGSQGLIVYLNDYQTSKIIEMIKPIFSEELQQRIIPIIPIEKNYASSTLLISPLLLDVLEQKMAEIRQFNLTESQKNTIDVTLFIATSFTTRLQEELKHIIQCMGATQVRILSLFDRQRMPFGRCIDEGISAYARMDLPAMGISNTCPICAALESLQNLTKALRDPDLQGRIDIIREHWKPVKSSDNHHGKGITIRHIQIPSKVQAALSEYHSVYGQGQIEISTDLGLSLFAIESTVISLSLDFLTSCIDSELDQSTKILLLSAHLLIFNSLQISEKYYCHLLRKLWDNLREQESVSQYTELAVVALCGQPSIFQRYLQEYLIKCAEDNLDCKNNDALLLRLAIYQSTRHSKHLQIPTYYRTDLHCFLINEQNVFELIYDVFLYCETDYRQSHRQAFGLIKGTSIKTTSEVYAQARTYTQKLIKIYELDHLRKHFHDTDTYDRNKKHIINCLRDFEGCLENISSDDDHELARNKMNIMLNALQHIQKGLYLRASDTEGISKWLSYCEAEAKRRLGRTTQTILPVLPAFANDSELRFDVAPWFYAHADVTEEVINLIVDMLQRSDWKLNNFLQPDVPSSGQAYDSIISLQFFKEYVQLSFYNAANTSLPIHEISKIKQSKANRPSMIAFKQFEAMLQNIVENPKITCFECNYVENSYPESLVLNRKFDDDLHLYCAKIRIPYTDMGSSFSN